MGFKKLLILAVCIGLFLSPKMASAHLAGQPPYFKVNGKYANLYPVPLTSLDNFDLPQDLPQENYLVNNPISFEIDTTQLPVPPAIVAKSKFYWDFDDGTTGTGLKNIHTYTKVGSYIIKIKVDDGTVPEPQLLESALINVLPDANYQLPKAVILVNGQGSSDPLTDILSDDFGKTIQIDGTSSKSSSTITSYFWDFGDEQTSIEPQPSHLYKSDLTQIFIVLRIKNSDGFLADNFIEVKNQANSVNSSLSSQIKNGSAKSATTAPAFPIKSPLIYIGGGIIALIVLAFIIKANRGKSKKPKQYYSN